jgi:formylglycine-generating enzyme required for sulfatase activity
LVENIYLGFRLASSLNPLSLSYFVSVGDVYNSADSTGYGIVNYVYSIAQYHVTNCEYAEFLNAVASTDTYNLYNTNMDSGARGGITRSGSSGSYTYTVKTNMGNKPVVYVSWFDCARYCNWLHNGKSSGNQDNTTTEDGAYTLNGATSGVSITRNVNANYFIPSENEWYKAAYYKGRGTNAGYWNYATQSDTDPTCVTADVNGNGPINSNYSCS